MKYVFILGAVGLAGCQSSPAPAVLPAPTKAIAAISPSPVPPAPVASTPSAGLEQKIRQQSQYIEALISQNDALAAKLAAKSATPQPAMTVPPPMPELAPVVPPARTSSVVVTEATLSPNVDGVIDVVAALVSPKPGEPVNPFTVRTVPPETVREVTLLVGGVAFGATPCAVVNDRLLQVGDAVDSLTIERIEADAVVARHSGKLLRLPVSEKPVRVRLPL